MNPSFFRRFLLPGFAFQAVMIGGGYASGRELVEFFLNLGPIAGLAGMIVSAAIVGGVSAVTFAFAYRYRSFDYASFFHHLLGRGAVAFEAIFICTLVLVLSVAGATAGEVIKALLGTDVWVGTLAFAGCSALATLRGSSDLDRLFKYWSFLLYGVYVLLIVMALMQFGGTIATNLDSEPLGDDWPKAGLIYAGYNLLVAVVVLHTLRNATRSSDAVIAGLLCGPLAMLPAFALFLALTAQYPQIKDAVVPALSLINALDARWFAVLYQVTVFGTLVETGAGMVHALNERVAGGLLARGQTFGAAARGSSSFIMLFVSLVIATQFGLVDLIARGYGTLTYAVLLVFVLPVLTWGVWKITSNRYTGVE
jgi:uncharacterized membrane protein YkvI